MTLKQGSELVVWVVHTGCEPTKNEVNTPNIDIRLSGYAREMCPNSEVSMCICRAIEPQ